MTHPDDLARENAALRARIDSARHTGDMARAQATELRSALECLLAGPTDAAQSRARAALANGDGGAALLTELNAARALGAWANNRRYWTCGICPACGFGKKIDGSEFHGSGCAIAAYNAATKARYP